MKPTETLKHEHKIILLVLAAAEKQAKAIEAAGKMEGDKIDKLLDFFRSFADRCHHSKEEKHFFVALERRDECASFHAIMFTLSVRWSGLIP